jgi:hypothetical protein
MYLPRAIVCALTAYVLAAGLLVCPAVFVVKAKIARTNPFASTAVECMIHDDLADKNSHE